MATVETVKGRYSSYKLLNDVGHGGSARVFRALDLATKREVAVKQLFGNRAQDREDWLREVDALHTLNNHHCPHVIQYLDHMQQHDMLFLVEEFAEQGSLLRRLRQEGPMPESRVCNFTFQILTTLHRMSQWSIIHGDLKASNLLLFAGDVVKLTDFALRSRGGDNNGTNEHHHSRNHHHHNNNKVTSSSRTVEQTTRVSIAGCEDDSSNSPHTGLASTSATTATTTTTTTTMASSSPLLEFRGSVYWAAPEVLAGESRLTAASDVWSVACTAIELLTGAPPYFDRSIPNATHHVLKYYYAVMEHKTPAVEEEREEEDKQTALRHSGEDAAGASAGVSPTPRSEQGKTGSGSFSGGRVREDEEEIACAGERGASGSNTSTAPEEEEEEKRSGGGKQRAGSLVPPLPESLKLSEECMSFLRACLRLRPDERPSAGELLQHEWFLSVVVPQLLQAAREGRGMGSAAACTGEDEMIVNGTNANNGSSASANPGNRFAVIEKWVELNLLSDQAARCEAWLRGEALPLLVPVLTPRIMTPKYIGNVMRCFSHFADANASLAPLFLDRLGATELWSVEELTSACDADHLVTLFRRCCEVQNPQVAVFTPTHPSALRFVLGLEKAKVQECAGALHRLLVEDPPAESAQHEQVRSAASLASPPSTQTSTVSPMPSGVPHDAAHEAGAATAVEKEKQQMSMREDVCRPDSSEAAGESAESETVPQESAQQQQQQRREQARERLLRDGGAGVLCQRVESQCKTAFLNNVAPTLEWGTINCFLDILNTVEALPGGASLLWGFPSKDSVALPALKTNVGTAGPTSAASLMTPRSEAVGPNNNSTGAATDTNAHPSPSPPLSLTPPRESLSPTDHHAGSPGTSNATVNLAANHNRTTNSPSPTTTGTATAAPTAAAAAAAAAAVHTNNITNSSLDGDDSTVMEWTSSLTWMLAVQESAHYGCDAAVRLLARYIHPASELKAEYLEKAGASLTSTLVLVASNDKLETELRCAAVGCLPRLQAASLRAARYLRDPVRCVPLLALTLKRSADLPALTTALLAALRALTSSEKQTLAACVGSPWMWDALIALLKAVEVQETAPRNSSGGVLRLSSTQPREQSRKKDPAASPNKENSSGSSSPSHAALANADDAHRAALRAMLTDILTLIAQWFADVSPSALLSMAAATGGVGRNMVLSPPPPPPPPLPPPVTSMVPSTLISSAHRGRRNVDPAAPPSLPALLQRLRAQLTGLADNEVLYSGEVVAHVEKTLEYLAPLDVATTAPVTVAAAMPPTK